MHTIIRSTKTKIIAMAIVLLTCVSIYTMRSQTAQVLPVSFVDLSLSPDGKNFLAASSNFEQGLLLVSIDGRKIRPISHTERAQWPVWGPDSKTIYFKSFTPNDTKDLAQRFAAPNLILSKDAFSDDSPETLLTVDNATGSDINYPTASPDGEHLSYMMTTLDANKDFIEHFCLFNLKTQQSVTVEGYQPVSYTLNPVQWSANGKTLYFRGMVGNDAFSLGQMRKRMNSSKNGIVIYQIGGATRFLAVDTGAWKVSNSGDKFALVTGRDSHGESNVLRVVDTNGKELNLTKDPSIFPDMFWSKDDSALYYLTGGAAGVVKIHRWNMADNSVTVVATETKRRGRLLGIANGRLYYSIVQGKDNSGDNSEVKSIPVS